MSAIGPGDWVERWRPWPGRAATVVGAIYRVEDVSPVENDCVGCEGCAGLKLQGVKPIAFDGYPCDWVSACFFRPVYRPKSEIIEALKHPAPSDRKKEEV